MARTPRAQAERVPGPAGGHRVEERLVEGALEFVTVGPGSLVWSASDPASFARGIPLVGAFVRIEPPPGASDEAVQRVRDAAHLAGAVRVFVLPRRRAAAVIEPRERRPHRRARDVVAELVAEANVEDREALAAFCEAVMAKRGIG